MFADLFKFHDHNELLVGSSNITVYALLKNIEWDVVVSDEATYEAALYEFEDKWSQSNELTSDIIYVKLAKNTVLLCLSFMLEPENYLTRENRFELKKTAKKILHICLTFLWIRNFRIICNMTSG